MSCSRTRLSSKNEYSRFRQLCEGVIYSQKNVIGIKMEQRWSMTEAKQLRGDIVKSPPIFLSFFFTSPKYTLLGWPD